MENGIGNVTIYIDNKESRKATYWQRLIKNAVNNWMYTGVGANKFYATYVGNNTGSKVDIYAMPASWWGSSGSSVLAETRFFNRNIVRVYPNQNDWYSASIYLNDDHLKQSSISDTVATGTIGHEFGHGFGLAHNNSNPNSLLCQVAYGRAVNTVQKVDNDALNRLY